MSLVGVDDTADDLEIEGRIQEVDGLLAALRQGALEGDFLSISEIAAAFQEDCSDLAGDPVEFARKHGKCMALTVAILVQKLIFRTFI